MAEPSYEEGAGDGTGAQALARKETAPKQYYAPCSTSSFPKILTSGPASLKRIGEQDVDVAPIINQFQQSRQTNT